MSSRGAESTLGTTSGCSVRDRRRASILAPRTPQGNQLSLKVRRGGSLLTKERVGKGRRTPSSWFLTPVFRVSSRGKFECLRRRRHRCPSRHSITGPVCRSPRRTRAENVDWSLPSLCGTTFPRAQWTSTVDVYSSVRLRPEIVSLKTPPPGLGVLILNTEPMVLFSGHK